MPIGGRRASVWFANRWWTYELVEIYELASAHGTRESGGGALVQYMHERVITD